MAIRPVTRFAGTLPKAGNAEAECEDAFCLAGSQLAIADGASEGSYSQVWAGILARAFCDDDAAGWQEPEFSSWIEACQREWSTWERDLAQKDLPWFTRDKLRQGAFAAFIGLALSASACVTAGASAEPPNEIAPSSAGFGCAPTAISSLS